MLLVGGKEMGIYSIVIALIIVIAIPVFEIIRKREGKFDYLSLFNLIFILAFGVVPLYIYLFPDKVTHWRVIIYSNITETSFFIGSLIALMFYVLMVIAYYFSSKLMFVIKTKKVSENIFTLTNNRNVLFKSGFLLFVIGGFSLLFYINLAGGLDAYINSGYSTRIQGQTIQHPLVFVRNFTPFLSVASFIFYATIRHSKGTAKFLNIILFLLSFVGAILVAFHSGGRMNFFIYLTTFPLATLLYQNKIKIRTILLVTAFFVFMVVYGRSFLNPEAELKINNPNDGIINSVIREFSFPFVNVGRSFDLFPDYFNFRGGIPDVLTAIAGLVPQRIVNFDFLQRETVSQFNTSLYGPGGEMPVDIVSFGYMSFGIVGVVMVALLFGTLLRWTENLFSYHKNLIGCIFSIALMINLAFRIMYGDPALFVNSVFRYAVAMIIIFGFLKLEKLPRIVWKKTYS